MTLAQLQDSIIDAWAKGAGMESPPKEARGPMYDVAATLGRAINKGLYTLDDITNLTKEKCKDEWSKSRPNVWSLYAVSRDLYAWKQRQKKHVKSFDPPPGFKSGLDPKTGLHRVWNRKTGKVDLIEMAPTPAPVKRPGVGTAYTPRLERTVIQQDYGRETYSHQFYMTPSEESAELERKLLQNMREVRAEEDE